jgi:hypothetical protein
MLAGLTISPIAARQATPIASRDVPTAAECHVAPISLAALQALSTPVPGEAPPTLPPATAEPLPAGEPLDDATLAAITMTAREAIACTNGGERLRALALYTDYFLRQSLGPLGPFPPELYQRLETPQPVAAEKQVALVAIRDGRRFSDGRVGAIVIVDDPAAVGGRRQSASFLFFALIGDRWLIDGAIEHVLDTDPTPSP